MSTVVIDASAVVDLLADTEIAPLVAARIEEQVLIAPAHLDAEVLSAMARMERAGTISAPDADRAIAGLTEMPVRRYPVAGLLAGAWRRRGSLRVLDALYAELAEQQAAELITTDARLARSLSIEAV
ncbi:type II toxin-antitoxin system VapC family toxin [Microlunatus soli]|uniref:Ribonuclease VapC n=1 Tax=Microlunatus soli TaxID=630515 RepID=A0A1H1ZZ97_9ACTN|nr:type II toxin-antitoxin system VapC family toxin [Microlunatus soli]SDT38742.1 Predicted nucleic acid-binding protein, contains PIN domain [Microlunatus soli]